MGKTPFLLFSLGFYFIGSTLMNMAWLGFEILFLIVFFIPGFELRKLIKNYIKSYFYIERASRQSFLRCQRLVKNVQASKIQSAVCPNLASYYVQNTVVPEELLESSSWSENVLKSVELKPVEPVDSISDDLRRSDSSMTEDGEKKGTQVFDFSLGTADAESGDDLVHKDYCHRIGTDLRQKENEIEDTKKESILSPSDSSLSEQTVCMALPPT